MGRVADLPARKNGGGGRAAGTDPRTMGPGRWDAHDHLLGRLESAKQATRELLPSCRCSPPCEVLPVHQMELRQRSLLEPAAARCTLPLLQQQSELQSHGQHAEAHATQCVRGAQRMSSAALFFLADAIHAAPINWSQQSVQHRNDRVGNRCVACTNHDLGAISSLILTWTCGGAACPLASGERVERPHCHAHDARGSSQSRAIKHNKLRYVSLGGSRHSTTTIDVKQSRAVAGCCGSCVGASLEALLAGAFSTAASIIFMSCLKLNLKPERLRGYPLLSSSDTRG